MVAIKTDEKGSITIHPLDWERLEKVYWYHEESGLPNALASMTPAEEALISVCREHGIHPEAFRISYIKLKKAVCFLQEEENENSGWLLNDALD